MSGSEQANRVLFFEAALSARRRARQSWAGTPVRTIFNFGDGEAFGALLATVAKVRSAVAAAGVDLVRCCEEADEDGNGFLDASEIVAVFDVRLRLGQCCAVLCCVAVMCRVVLCCCAHRAPCWSLAAVAAAAAAAVGCVVAAVIAAVVITRTVAAVC